ncbi:hypothetical protein BC941DRAFT_445826 [Chlamydoabsidia padenii]|nr:hypothetical protein BC941DRAFT_445826 [Chlamydoabsidia padenii]
MIESKLGFLHSGTRQTNDPYHILGIPPSANQVDIKKAYYTLAKKYHPDTSKDKDAQDKFAQVQQAYEMLSGDQHGFHRRGFTSTFGEDLTTSSRSRHGFEHDSNEGFHPFFGGGAGHHRQPHTTGRDSDGFRIMSGENIQTPLTITFIEAAKGTKKTVWIDQVTRCSSCQGTGMKAGISLGSCHTCQGRGIETVRMGRGGYPMQTTCTTCHGSGNSIPFGGECGSCKGIGKVRERTAVEIDIPPGVDNKARLRVPGQGDAPLQGNGPHGDLFVSLNILPSSIFRRQEKDVFMDTKIPFYKAILGGQVQVPTLDGDVELTIPTGSQMDDTLVLEGKGIQQSRGTSRGDQIVTLKVELPSSLDGDRNHMIKKYATLVDPEYRTMKN